MTAEQLDLVLENRHDAHETPSISTSISEQVSARSVDALTVRQAQVLRGIEYAIANHGRPPTRRELLSMLGTTSQRRLRELLDAIARKGFLRIDDGVDRGIAVLVSSSEAVIDDARAQRPGLAKASPRTAVARKAVG